MKKFYFTLFFALVLCGFSNAQTFNAIEPELQQILDQKGENLVNIHIYFKSKVDSKRLDQKTRKLLSKSEKRNIVVSELMNQASTEQADVMALLKAEESNGNVSNIKALWISNSISCKASRNVIYQLSSHPDIKLLGVDEEIQMISPEQMKEIPATEANITRGPASHIVTVNADDVQNQGYTGKNVIVAVLDSGTNTEHVDLKDHLWEGYVEGELVNGWNCISDNSNITDDYGHGTHCAGIVCGDGTAGTTTGVAPDALLMTLKTISRVGTGSVAQMISGVQFAVENGADVLSISLGFKHSQLTVAQKESIRNAFDNVLRAGVVACAAVGNDGTNIGLPWNVDYPAACPAPWRNPNQTLEGYTSGVIAVGADDLIGRSSQGPSTWEDTSFGDYAYNNGASMGLIRPDISAPGNLIYSTNFLYVDKYKQMAGSSQATPCVAGVVALMLEKNAALSPEKISQFIEETAANKPDTKNNVVGAGRIDALAAVNKVTQGSSLPYLRLQSFTPTVLTQGSGQNIGITLKNYGKGSSGVNTTATLSLAANTPYVSLTETTQTAGAINEGYSKELNFNIDIDPSTPNGHIVNFIITTTSNTAGGTLTWKDKFSVKVTTEPNLVFHSVTPGNIDANEDAVINVKMVNNGTADMTSGATIRLSTLPNWLNNYVRIIDDEATIPALGINETADCSFTIHANSTIPNNFSLDLFLETYSESTTITDYTFEFENGMEGWTSFNASANVVNFPWWHSSDALSHGKSPKDSHSGNGHLMSETTNSGLGTYEKPIDNYLVSPYKIVVTDNTKVSFYARPHETNYYKEHFGLAVSTTGNSSANDFTMLQEWTITEPGTEWKQYTVDLSAYTGQEVHIAIRHFFTTDDWNDPNKADEGMGVDALNIDDIVFSDVKVNNHHVPSYSNDDPNYFTVTVGNMIDLPKVEGLSAITDYYNVYLQWDAVPVAQGYNVYCNGQRIASNVKTNTFTHENLTHNTEYCYEVAALYSGVEFDHSDKYCTKTMQKELSIAVTECYPKNIYYGTNDDKITMSLLIDGANSLKCKGVLILSSDSPYLTLHTNNIDLSVNFQKPGETVTTGSTSGTSNIGDILIGINPNIPNNTVVTINAQVVCYYRIYPDPNYDYIQNNYDYEINLEPIQITVKNDPGTPTNLRVLRKDNSSITLTWDAVNEAICYNIYRNGVCIGNTASIEFYDNNLEANTEYYYTATSYYTNGESDHCEKLFVTTDFDTQGIILKSYEMGIGLGQNIELKTILANKGNEPTSAGSAILQCSDPYVTVVEGTKSMNAMDAGDETEVTFIIELATNTPQNHILNFNLTTEYQGEASKDIAFNFNNSSEFNEWTRIDYSNPFYPIYLWEYDNEKYCAISYSYKDGVRNVDNLLISPIKVKISENTSVSYKVASTATTSNYCKEYYEVILMKSDNFYELLDSESVHNEELKEEAKDSNWQNREISLGDYSGEEVWIIFRHKSKVQNAIILDDIIFNNISSVGTITNTSTFVISANPSINIYTGTGTWNETANWSKKALPGTKDDVIISGNVTIESGDITVKSLSINNNYDNILALNSGVMLKVNGICVNKQFESFIIKDGAQIVQSKNNVLATFRMTIESPSIWNSDHKGGWQFVSSPVLNANIEDFNPGNGRKYDLFKYDGTKELQWVNYKYNASSFENTFQEGRGYIVSYEETMTADFKGNLNNATSFEFSDLKKYDENDYYNNFYLLGNPFTFDMDLDFNSGGKTKTTANGIYPGYATISNKNGVYSYHTSGTIKVGDGFLVKVTEGTPYLGYGGTRSRSVAKNESLNVIASSIHGSDNVIVRLDGEEEEGFTKLDNLNEDISEIYIANNGERFGIFSFDEDVKEVNLSFKTKHTGSHIISIKPEGKFEYVTLVDNFTGEETDMLKERYEFMVYSTEGSRERFTLKFSKKAEPESENFVYQSGNELIVEAEGTVQIIDVMGRMIFSEEINGSGRINVSGLDKAAYIVRCIGSSKINTQKIVIL